MSEHAFSIIIIIILTGFLILNTLFDIKCIDIMSKKLEEISKQIEEKTK